MWVKEIDFDRYETRFVRLALIRNAPVRIRDASTCIRTLNPTCDISQMVWCSLNRSVCPKMYPSFYQPRILMYTDPSFSSSYKKIIGMTPEPLGQSESRRTHRKSKTGCLTCKKRHVKCDEARPRCAKCTFGDRTCSYAAAPNQRPKQVELNTSIAGSATNSPAGSSSSTALLADARSPSAAPGRYDAVHMSLLHYAIANMASYMGLGGDISPVVENALNSAKVAPYLLDQLLALSALYQSTTEQEHQNLFLQYATELQTRALGQFLEVRESISEVNFMPTFLFTTLVGIHVLYNTLEDHNDNLGEFISAFVDYMRVHRGIRAVTADYWDQILVSNLASLIGTFEVSHITGNQEGGIETIELRKQLEMVSDPSRLSVTASIDALQRMQWVIDLANHNTRNFSSRIQAALAWPVIISDDFIDALYLRHPEALAVLAFFLAFLCEVRSFWVFKSCDGTLVKALVSHLGPFWKEGLSWPLSIVAGS